MNWAKNVVPMPTMTASTITLMPDDNDVAEHAFGQERGLAPKRERHQHEARQCGQLELEDRDEELNRQNEERENHDEPGDHQHQDGDDVCEEAGEADQLAGLLHQGICRGKPVPASLPGRSKSAAVSPFSDAVKPRVRKGIEDERREHMRNC